MFIANSKYIIGLFRYALSPLRNKGLNDDSEDEDNELPNLDHQDDPSTPCPPPEPPDVEKCLEPEAGIVITKVFKDDFMADILPTLPTLSCQLTLHSLSFFIYLLRE
ncbi:hypothetical protein Tco_0156342 [Tanacetum coccineum]